MTVFDFSGYQELFNRIFGRDGVKINLRTRLACKLHTHESLKKNAQIHVMNEIVVDRGANPNMLTLDLYVGELHLTTLFADGLVVATATGSTAYSVGFYSFYILFYFFKYTFLFFFLSQFR